MGGALRTGAQLHVTTAEINGKDSELKCGQMGSQQSNWLESLNIVDGFQVEERTDGETNVAEKKQIFCESISFERIYILVVQLCLLEPRFTNCLK